MDTKLLYELSEKADVILQSDDKEKLNDIITVLKPIVKEIKRGSIGIAQINTIPGDIEHNAKKIIKYISYASKLNLDMVIFPEFALTGFPLEDAIERFPYSSKQTYDWLCEIAKYTGDTVAVVGYLRHIEYIDDSSDKVDKTGNISTLAVLKNGKYSGLIEKSVLPKNSIIKDYNHISPGNHGGYYEFQDDYTTDGYKGILEVNGIKYAISNDCAEFIEDQDVLTAFGFLKENNPDVYINCSNSTSYKKQSYLDRCLGDTFKYKKPFVYVNQVGAVDCLSFDGASCVFDKYSVLSARAKSYEEQFFIVNPLNEIGTIYPSPNEKYMKNENKSFSLDYEDEMERTYKIVIQGIKDYFWKNGIKRACLGLSGGLDSSVCAVVLTDALGKENVFGISMPSKITSNQSKTDAEELANNLGINYIEIPIKDVVTMTNNVFNNMFAKIERKWNFRYKKSFTMDNIQARARATYLWGIANEFDSCIPIATSDKSEAYMGYATINGDMSGGYAPIADITKTKLFALAHWLNENREIKNVIPKSVLTKRPGAELAIDEKTGEPLKAEDALMPYEFLDEVIWRIENNHETFDDMIKSEFIYEKNNVVSKEQKEQWLDKFFKRMNGALYKGSIMPPYIVIDIPTINKKVYNQPITSKINYKELSADDIKTIVKNSFI